MERETESERVDSGRMGIDTHARSSYAGEHDRGHGGYEALDRADEPPDARDSGSGAAHSDRGDAVDRPRPPELTADDLSGKSRDDIRAMADRHGLEPFGKPDADGNPRKWKDPSTGQERLRIDTGHVDQTTGKPYNDPKAAVDHVHGYDRSGRKIRDPQDNNPHFPLQSRGDQPDESDR
jgi:hypothetical protein